MQGEDLDCSGQSQMISVAEWGGSHELGKKWRFIPKSGNISEIIIGYQDNVIDFIKFKGARDSDYSPIFGEDANCVRTEKITLDFPSQFLTGLSGSYSSYFIRSIKFHTKTSEYGPFGNSSDSSHTQFSFNANAGGLITGFHGRCDSYVNAIGVYVMPINASNLDADKPQHSQVAGLVPKSAGPWGGNGGREWDDGVFSTVKEVHVKLKSPPMRSYTSLIAALRVIYTAEDGSDFLSPVRGTGENPGWQTIVFGDKSDEEVLIGIEGFFGPLEGVDVIRSLTFITNKGKRHGPFGDEIGTFFTSIMDCNSNRERKVVRICGRSGYFLDAIGLHYL